jgi:hypothetical protein
MPTVRLIEKSSIRRPRRRNERKHQERKEARQILREVHAPGRALGLTLEPKERAATIKPRYRSVAKEENLKPRFRTVQHRMVRNRAGKQQKEAAVLVVQVG